MSRKTRTKGKLVSTKISFHFHSIPTDHKIFFPIVCEDVCNQVNLFDDGKTLVGGLQDHSQLKEMTKNLTTITMLEERVNEWIKKVMEV